MFRVNALGRQLDVTERKAVVAQLRAEGKTQRQIATKLGVGVGTVNRDLSQMSESGDVPDGTVSERDEPDTLPSPPEPAKPSKHECTICGLVMPKPAWHCEGCGSHYEHGVITACAECNPPTLAINDQENDPVTSQAAPAPQIKVRERHRKEFGDIDGSGRVDHRRGTAPADRCAHMQRGSWRPEGCDKV